MRREGLRYAFGFALLLPLPALATTAECRVGERIVPCILVEPCVALGGVLRDHEGVLMCCFADERCTEAVSLADGPRPRSLRPRAAPVAPPGGAPPADPGR